MQQQWIISVSREYGSGGHEIASALAEEFGLPLFDKKMLRQHCEEQGMDIHAVEHYDEAPRMMFGTKRIRGMSSSPEENVAMMQFARLHQEAAAGHSFVVLGRCGEEILRDEPGLISIFVLADIGFRKRRIRSQYQVPEYEVLQKMADMDRRRRFYHNEYCRGKWGDSRNYDLCVNTAALGMDGTIEFLKDYVRRRMQAGEN